MKEFKEYCFKYDEEPHVKITYFGGFITCRRNELCVRVERETLIKLLQVIDDKEIILSIVNKTLTEEQVK